MHCETCLIDFNADFDRSVEVVFRPAAAIRPVEAQEFCVGGPQLTPHIVAQQLLPPRSKRTIETALEAGSYRIRALSGKGVQPVAVVGGGKSSADIRLGGDGWATSNGGLRLDEHAALTVENSTGDEQLIVLERTAWSDRAATAAEVTSLQLFRDLFAADIMWIRKWPILRKMRLLCWFAASVGAICHAQMTPLRSIVTQPTASSISILSIHFQELKYGHEGPGYFWVQHAPYRGKPALVEVTLYGQDAIRSVQFELVDQHGLRLATPVAVRIGSGADSDEYWLQLDVPLQPFRFGIRGEDVRGQPFQRVDKHLYTPIEGNVPPPTLPADLPSAAASTMRRLLDRYANDVQARFEAARQAHPDGIIVLARAEVLEAEYEPLFSSASHEIGLRLHLAVRFGAEGDYAVTPTFFSQYENPDWRQITLKVLDGSASPQPSNIAADMLDDVLRYGGAAHYLEKQVYRFQFDLAPSYVIRNVARTRYCIYSEYYRVIGRPGIWDAVQNSAVPVKYRVRVSSLDFEAETKGLPPQRAYLESFRREGSSDCGPTPTNRF